MSSLKRGDGIIAQVTADAAYTVDVPVKIGSKMFGVPVKTVANGAIVGVEISGIFALPKVGGGGITFALGDKVYWSAGTSKATATATDDLIGVCVATAGNAATSVQTLLNGGVIFDQADADAVAAAGAVMDSDFSGTHRGIMVRTAAGAYTAQRQNVAAVVAPAVTDDSDSFYAIGSIWIDITAQKIYVCEDATVGAANWIELFGSSIFDANTILAANVDNTPLALVMAANTMLLRAGGSIAAQPVAAQEIVLRGAANIVAQAVAASEFVGRPVAGNLGVVTATQARAIIQATTEALFDELCAAGVVDGDRLKALGLTQANLAAALAVDALDPATEIAKWKADSITAAVVEKLFAAGAISATVDGRAAMAAGYFNAAALIDKIGAAQVTNAVVQAIFAAGAFGADAPSRAAFVANFFDLATLADKVANDAVDNAFVQAKFAAGAFGADADSRAAFVANFFNALTFGAKVAAGAIDYSKLVAKTDQNLSDDDVDLTAANMLGAMRIAAAGPPRSKATATAAAIVAALTGAQVGSWFDMGIANTGVSTLTLTIGAGVTFYGSAVVAATGAAAGFGTWRVVCTNVTPAAEAVSMYRIG